MAVQSNKLVLDGGAWASNVLSSVFIIFINKILMSKSGYKFQYGEVKPLESQDLHGTETWHAVCTCVFACQVLGCRCPGRCGTHVMPLDMLGACLQQGLVLVEMQSLDATSVSRDQSCRVAPPFRLRHLT